MEHRLDEGTPFRLQNHRHLAANLAAFRRLLDRAPEAMWVGVVETAAGEGHQTAVLRDRFPRAPITSIEWDAECAEKIRERELPGVEVRCEDRAGVEILFGSFIVADENVATYREPYISRMRALLDTGPIALVFTDIALGKLHLNFRSYGLDLPDPAAYFARWWETLAPHRRCEWERSGGLAYVGLF